MLTKEISSFILFVTLYLVSGTAKADTYYAPLMAASGPDVAVSSDVIYKCEKVADATNRYFNLTATVYRTVVRGSVCRTSSWNWGNQYQCEGSDVTTTKAVKEVVAENLTLQECVGAVHNKSK